MSLPVDSIAHVARTSPLSGVAERAVRDTTNSGQITCDIRRRGTRAISLAEIAEIAQTSKASIKWASDRSRDVPPEIAQTRGDQPSLAPASAGTSTRGQPINRWWGNPGVLESAKTGNTEIRLAPGRAKEDRR